MKPWYKSKTLWFNALSALVLTLETSMRLMSSNFGPEVMQTVTLVIVIGNVFLRFATDTGIYTREL